MKILVICQYYHPEPLRITDICEELVKRGHEVTVLTDVPNYPMGRVYPAYKGKHIRKELINGVNVLRSFTIARRKGIFWRFLNYYSYAFSSSRRAMHLSDEYDVVLVNQLSPVMMAKAGIKYKKKHGKRLVLYCLDLWPDSLVVGGIKRDSLIYAYFRRVSERIYKSADKLLVTSKMFSRYFTEEFAIPPEKLSYLPQYAEDIFKTSSPNPEKETVDLLFAGNIGTAQSIHTIIKAAKRLESIENLRWHIVGDGSELDSLIALAKELDVSSVVFHGRKPLDAMPEYYALADAMLVTLVDDSVLSLTLPGKVQSYMAAGKPVIGAVNGEAAQVIADSGCGFCVSAGDDEALASAVKEFISSDRALLAQNSRSYYDKNFSREHFFDTLEEKLASEKAAELAKLG